MGAAQGGRSRGRREAGGGLAGSYRGSRVTGEEEEGCLLTTGPR